MRLIDEIAHRHNALADRVTDFYFVQRDKMAVNRFKVTETARPVRIVGGEVDVRRYDYVVSVLRPTGWVEIARIGQEHVDTAMQAAKVALHILTEDES